MLIRNKQLNGKGMFFVEMDRNILAEMVYTMPSPNKMIIKLYYSMLYAGTLIAPNCSIKLI